MFGTMMLAGLGCAALMRNPRRKKRRAKSRRRNPSGAREPYETEKGAALLRYLMRHKRQGWFGQSYGDPGSNEGARILVNIYNDATAPNLLRTDADAKACKRVAMLCRRIRANHYGSRIGETADGAWTLNLRNPQRKKRSRKSKRSSKGWVRTTTVTRVTKMTRKNPRKGAKTKRVYVLQGYYPGSGWSDVLEEDSWRPVPAANGMPGEVGMREQLKTYRENDRGTAYRSIQRRVPIEEPAPSQYRGIGTPQSNPRSHTGRKITKKQWYAQGAWSNSKLYRVQKGGRWHYYQTNPRRPGNLGLHDKPLASKGLTSYRLKMPHGYVMIGANSHAEAMREAGRSVDRPERFTLEVWDGSKYTPVSSNPRRRGKRKNRR